MKKITALLLALMIVLSMSSLSAFADTQEDLAVLSDVPEVSSEDTDGTNETAVVGESVNEDAPEEAGTPGTVVGFAETEDSSE